MKCREDWFFEKKFGHAGLRISGAGVGLTRLVFNNEPSAILVRLDTDIRATDISPAFSIDGVSLVAQGKCGTAVQLERRDPTRQGGIAEKRFSNLAIEGKDGSWEMGIKVIDVTFCTFRDITLRPQNPKGTGIFITGQQAPVDHHLNLFSAVDTGIRLGKDASNINPTDSVFRATGKELVRENSKE